MEISFEIDYNPLGNPDSDFKATITVIENFSSFSFSSYFSIVPLPCHFLVAWGTAIFLSLPINIVQENKPHLIKHTSIKYLSNMCFRRSSLPSKDSARNTQPKHPLLLKY